MIKHSRFLNKYFINVLFYFAAHEDYENILPWYYRHLIPNYKQINDFLQIHSMFIDKFAYSAH